MRSRWLVPAPLARRGYHNTPLAAGLLHYGVRILQHVKDGVKIEETVNNNNVGFVLNLNESKLIDQVGKTNAKIIVSTADFWTAYIQSAFQSALSTDADPGNSVTTLGITGSSISAKINTIKGNITKIEPIFTGFQVEYVRMTIDVDSAPIHKQRIIEHFDSTITVTNNRPIPGTTSFELYKGQFESIKDLILTIVIHKKTGQPDPIIMQDQFIGLGDAESTLIYLEQIRETEPLDIIRRRRSEAVTIVHEVGHQFGADHFDVGIMSSRLSDSLATPLFSPSSIDRMRRITRP